MARFDSVSNALELLVHDHDRTPGEWEDVLRRAGAGSVSAPRPARRSRRAAALVLALAALTLATTAFATGLADRFSSWATGKPGRPAPAAAQQAFAHLNARAYSSFPHGTKLRLLLSKRLAGKEFELLGLQDGDTYCLRLIRADLPHDVGQTACLRAAELDGNDAVVAGDPRFEVGDPAIEVSGVYGFVSDDVRSLLVSRLDSPTVQAEQGSNAFLSLHAQASGSLHHPPAADPVTTIVAEATSGKRRLVPYVSEGSTSVGRYLGAHPTVPSYFGSAGTSTLPGPSTVAYKASTGIGWIARREPLGKPFPKKSGIGRFGTIEWGRVIQPDPSSPIRVGVVLFKAGSGPAGANARESGQIWPCLVSFAPLARRADGMGCDTEPGKPGPLTLGTWIESPITTFTGLASDAVSSLTAYLANGRTVQAALSDNVFLVSLPLAELPARLVAYDSRHRPVAVTILGGGAVTRPCPTAATTTGGDASARPLPWQKLDLETLEVDGAPILRRTVAQIVAALGRPARIIPSAGAEDGVPIPALLYGGTTIDDAGLVIDFTKHGSKIVASSLHYSSQALDDARLGHILELQPGTLQAKVRSAFAGRYRLELAYGSDPGVGCSGTFVSATGRQGFSFGLSPYNQPYRPFLTIASSAAAASGELAP